MAVAIAAAVAATLWGEIAKTDILHDAFLVERVRATYLALATFLAWSTTR